MIESKTYCLKVTLPLSCHLPSLHCKWSKVSDPDFIHKWLRKNLAGLNPAITCLMVIDSTIVLCSIQNPSDEWRKKQTPCWVRTQDLLLKKVTLPLCCQQLNKLSKSRTLISFTINLEKTCGAQTRDRLFKGHLFNHCALFHSGSLDESQNFLFIPLLHVRGSETFEDFEDNIQSKLVLVIFETLSYFPGEDPRNSHTLLGCP